jgi:hypothetical protein
MSRTSNPPWRKDRRTWFVIISDRPHIFGRDHNLEHQLTIAYRRRRWLV